jgi:hypothetical protein
MRKVRGQAVRGHDVEADTREQRDATRRRLGAARRQCLEHRELAGDIEVMDAAPQAAVDHRSRRMHERTRAVQHRRHAVQRPVHRVRIVERRRSMGEAKWTGDRREPVGIAPRQDRTQSRIERLLDDQLAGVPIRPVDEQRSGRRHAANLHCGRRQRERDGRTDSATDGCTPGNGADTSGRHWRTSQAHMFTGRRRDRSGAARQHVVHFRQSRVRCRISNAIS